MNDPIITDHTDHLPQNRIGMTVREEIASRVLVGLIYKFDPTDCTYWLCKKSIDLADALIEELERAKK